ncbi:hypothetical protein EV130_104130 [Rhizobium azibense]|uniref:Uncharacterized protein n=1 Tax=Rhizobium azibense TaxID=1136135 RepID=A0A4R3QYP4_9HYPH|nr:hypothetical protein [Rhizobium azibense]TCU26519.1 hypothetical protein EV130_104130 [Rhizobium azibense]
MTSIPNLDAEVDEARQRVMRTTAEQRHPRNGPLIAMVVMLLPINAGILIYTAKNAGDLRESRETIVALKRSIDGLKAQVDKQGRIFVENAKADDVAVIRQQTESLQKTISIMNERMRSGSFASRGSGALVLSAPGKEPTQFFAPSPAAPPAGNQSPDGGITSIDAQGVSVDNLPRYERTVSPEGKLILRKVQ